MYRRSLLKKYQIKFTNTRANEDAGFNHLYFLLALKENEEEGVKELQEAITYNWNWNPNSITRINNKEYKFGIDGKGGLNELKANLKKLKTTKDQNLLTKIKSLTR